MHAHRLAALDDSFNPCFDFNALFDSLSTTSTMACEHVQVVATEVSKASVTAARHNIQVNGIDNIFLARMSSEEFVETWRVKGTRNRLAGLDWEQLSLNTLLVDPPRCVGAWHAAQGGGGCKGAGGGGVDTDGQEDRDCRIAVQ